MPIGPLTRNWTSRGKQWQRTMLPLTPAYSFSVHKSQGQTIPLMLLDIGHREFASGLTYTALTRVKSLEHLCFAVMPSIQRIKNIFRTKSFKLLKEFLEHKQKQEVETLQNFSDVF